jgi:hypothetical protein
MRFTEKSYYDPSRLDFVPRDYRAQFMKVVAVFTLSLLVLLAIGVLDLLRGTSYSPMAGLLIIVIMSVYIVVLKQRDFDLVMNTEYLNMLLAQGVALGGSFYYFVKRDGTVAYVDDGMRKLFPHVASAESQPIDRIFEHGQMLMSDRERLKAAILECKAERLVAPLVVAGKTVDYWLTIDPLPRPAGMLLVRGREFHHRYGA